MIYFNKKALLSILTIALLTACGQSTTGTVGSDAAAKAVQTTQTTSTSTSTSTSTPPSGLLASLAVTYPNGQIQADNASQAAKELAQNPAALKLTAQSETSVTTSSQSATSPIQAQATVADYKAVTRIQNTTLTGAYFFTIYDTEQAAALAGNPKWKLEGPAFWASLATGTGLSPVHRFRNNLNGSYLYTIYETEKADIQANYASTFFYEGVAWYARQTADAGWSPLYRFRNLLNGTYLFSAYESEKDAIVANYSAVFKLEGVAYHVRQDAPAACTAAATGKTGYSLVFKGCNADNIATYYDKTECVRDNASGLIWQGQTAAGTGLRANNQYKTNFDSITSLQKYSTADATLSAPTQAEVDASTNSIGFKKAVNATNLCGSGAWRLPTKDELLGIVKTTETPKIDNVWFPNTPPDALYWASTSYPGETYYGWYIDFSFGGADYNARDFDLGNGTTLVRLVR